MDITERQQELLIAIIREFIDTGSAVGSLSLQEKLKLNVSPATIRNEMAELVKKGYLYMKHSSGGRIPTTKAWRFYIHKVKPKNPINVIKDTEQEIKYQLNILKFETEKLIMRSLDYLHHMTAKYSNCFGR
ncbi:MAG: hypothetical protein KatS3mg085_667 [Candidatus Dojkabacteria bacterium]|nr:MAG: hypothetical protein KatS3mg085_667 [Candidatus Dojkabacteria bacterium]